METLKFVAQYLFCSRFRLEFLLDDDQDWKER